MIDRAAERLEKEKWAGGLLFVRSGGFAVPESFFCLTARLKSCPSHDRRGLYGTLASHPFRKEREKGWGTHLVSTISQRSSRYEAYEIEANADEITRIAG